MEKSVNRFIALYQEQKDHARVLGTIVIMIGTNLVLGLLMIVFVVGFQGLLYQRLIQDPLAISMLVILIALAPIQALESLITGLLSSFARPKAIFFRKHLVGPFLYFAVVLVLTLAHGGPHLIAGAYLLAGVVGVGISMGTVLRIMREKGILSRENVKNIKLPWYEIFGFTSPLLISNVVFVLRTQFVVILLEYFKSTVEVADYRAVFPVARFNMVVYQNFVILFMPLAARMFARDDLAGMNVLYRKTAVWIAVISFPLFAASSTLAKPLIHLLFGERYHGSANVLMLLSIGFYFSAALGFNGQTLRIFGKVRHILISDLVTAVVSIVVSLMLIPRYGALGAGISICGTLILQNSLYQLCMMLSTGVGWFAWDQLKVYSIIVIFWFGLLLLPDISLSLMVAAIVSLLVIRINRKSLDIERTFPELFRFPLMRRIFGG